MELLKSATEVLADKCISELRLDHIRNSCNARTIIPLLTELTKRHGYSRVNEICKQAQDDLTRLRKLLAETFPEAREK